MERFSLSSPPPLPSSLSLCIYPGRLEEHVYGGLREKNHTCTLPVICLCVFYVLLYLHVCASEQIIYTVIEECK